MSIIDIEVYDGKYRYIQYNNGSSECFRHGERWRDTTGDGFILALAQEVCNLRHRLSRLEGEGL